MTTYLSAMTDTGRTLWVPDDAYAPGITALWMPAQFFTAVSGSANLAAFSPGRAAAFHFDAAAAEYIASTTKLPADWVTMDVDLYWSSAQAAPSGNAELVVEMKEYVAGDSMNNAPASIGSLVEAAPATQYALKITTVATAAAVTPSKWQMLRISRNGASGSDTLAGDLALFGIMLRKAS